MSDRTKNEIKHGKKIAADAESIWNWSSPAGQKRWERRKKMLTEFITEEMNVLEIGCGTGLLTSELIKKTSNLTAIDISQDLIDIARKKIELSQVNFSIQNAWETKFESESFDAVVGSSVLHHLEADKAIAEFFRVLKSRGKICFTEPNMLNPQIALQKNIPWIKSKMGDSPDESAFFKWQIRKLLLENNFTNIKIFPFDFLHPAIPTSILDLASPFCNQMENIPFLREIAGSLFIFAEKSV